MIEGFIGRPGSGKTYTMTKRALQQHAHGKPIYANYRLNIPGAHYMTFSDLLELDEPGIILIDEAHLWMPSRMSMKLPPSAFMKFSQTRKFGWHIFWSAQHESKVDKVLKDVSNWFWLCNTWRMPWDDPDTKPPRMFTAKAYEPAEFRKANKHAMRSAHRFKKRIANAYDTHERLEVASHVSSMADHYKAEGRSPRAGAGVPSAGSGTVKAKLRIAE